MDAKKITFKKALKADKELVQKWLKKPHAKQYWDNIGEIEENFAAYIKGTSTECTYWICSYDKVPFALLLTADVSKQPPGYLVPWFEPEGMTLLLDFIILEKAYLGKGYAVPMLLKFLEIKDANISAFLADPEVKNERAIQVLEKTGFVKVSTFIKGEGFFKGKPCYLMKKIIS